MTRSCGFVLVFLLSLFPSAMGGIVQEAYLKASNTDFDQIFGHAVAIWGDTVVVGAPGEGNGGTGVNPSQSGPVALNSGAAYVFVRAGTNWSQQAYIKASNTGAGDQFGHAVAISGDTIVVGAFHESSNATGVNGNQRDNSATGSGAAYVFVRSGTNWTQQAYLKASNTRAGAGFGGAIAASADTVVIGAGAESSNATGVNGSQTNTTASGSGAAYVFARSGTNWTQQAYLKASNTGVDDSFGSAVAISGDTALVGAYGESSNAIGANGNQSDNSAPDAGAAYVFVRSGTNWSQQAYLKASNTGPLDQFGWAVSLSGDTAAIGAYSEASNATGVNGNQSNNSATGSGACYVFVRSGTNWSQQAYLKASNPETNDYFGWSVGVSSNTVVVGAFGESSNATGVNGNQNDNSDLNSGAAYVFVRSGTNWSQQAYVKASNTDPGDYFGWSVAVSAATAVIGAINEASGARGVNGDQSDNVYNPAGAAYVFTGVGPESHVTITRDGGTGYFVRLTGPPGSVCRLQRSGNPNAGWSTIATPTLSASGSFEFHDPAPPPGRSFYRTIQP